MTSFTNAQGTVKIRLAYSKVLLLFHCQILSHVSCKETSLHVIISTIIKKKHVQLIFVLLHQI